jgi:hypothetical protein
MWSIMKLALFQCLIIASAFVPMLGRNDVAPQVGNWVVNVASNILVGFVAVNVAAGVGVIRNTPFSVSTFVGSLLGATAAVVIFTQVFLTDGKPRKDAPPSAWPRTAWFGSWIYWVGLSLLYLGIFELSRLASTLLIVIGVIIMVGGLVVAQRALPTGPSP